MSNKFHGEELNLKVCDVCDGLVIQERSSMKVLDCEFNKVMKIRLRNRENMMDSNLNAFYDISEQFHTLQGILLSNTV